LASNFMNSDFKLLSLAEKTTEKFVIHFQKLFQKN